MVTTESNDIITHWTHAKDWRDIDTLTLVAEPQDIEVSSRPIVWSPIGDYLEPRGYLPYLIAFIAALNFVMSLIDVETVDFEVAGGIRIRRRSSFHQVCIDLAAIMFFFLLCHR